MAHQHSELLCRTLSSSFTSLSGAGRHGQGSLFLSTIWALNPDGVTFGKAIASGVFPLSGVAIRCGSSTLLQSRRKVVQSHTYSGSSELAYLTATQVLKEVPAWFGHAQELGRLVAEVLGPLQDEDFSLRGQGLLWGGELLRPGPADLDRLKQLCHREGVWPYFVEFPKTGFIISPALDISETDFHDGLRRLARCLHALKNGESA